MSKGSRMAVREAVLGQTLPFSFAGVPTLSLPYGFHEGLPLGLQVVGRRDGRRVAAGAWGAGSSSGSWPAGRPRHRVAIVASMPRHA